MEHFTYPPEDPAHRLGYESNYSKLFYKTTLEFGMVLAFTATATEIWYVKEGKKPKNYRGRIGNVLNISIHLYAGINCFRLVKYL